MSVDSPQVAAQSLALSLQEHLGRIEKLLQQQLELSHSSARNFIGSGTVAGGGSTGTTPLGILNGNPKRRGLSVQNLAASGGGNLTLGLGTTAPQNGTGFVLEPGGVGELTHEHGRRVLGPWGPVA